MGWYVSCDLNRSK